MAESFRDEYQRGLLDLRNEERELAGRKKQMQLLQTQIAAAQEPNGELEQEALNYINDNDLVALKSTYKRLFHKIIVRPRNEANAELEFVLKQTTAPSGNGEVKFCTAVGLVGLGGLEPPTSRLSGAYSNQLSYRPCTIASTGVVAKSEGQKQPQKNSRETKNL